MKNFRKAGDNIIMKHKLTFFVLLCIFLFPVKIGAQEMVTVKLVKDIGMQATLDIRLKGDYLLLDSTTTLEEGVNYRLTGRKGKIILTSDVGTKISGDSFYLIPMRYDTDHYVEVNGKPYLGAMEFRLEESKFIRPVNQLPVEDYLKGVVPFEVFPTWSIETLKAQALAARTYIFSHVNEEINDTVQYQVYGGYEWSDKATKAVEETINEVITFKGKLIEAFYSASNGGMTESNSNVWGGKPLDYFPVKEDRFDPKLPWEFSLHQVQHALEEINWEHPDWWEQIQEKDEQIIANMTKWLNKNGYLGDIKILTLQNLELSNEQFESKRYKKGSITIEFLHRLYDGTVMYEQVVLKDRDLSEIRSMIGGTTLKSLLIHSIELDNGMYTVKGKGFGHGVGMSQWGASVMGENGLSYRDIIQHYFPGTKVVDIYDVRSFTN